MIKNINLKIACDPRGNISSGHKTEAGYPESLDYFNISKFPELIEAYGEKPTALVLFFPTNRITDFLDCNYQLWGKNNKLIRSCDGEKCLHRINEEVNGKKYAAGEETECICNQLPAEDKKRCRFSGWFKAFVALPRIGKIDNPMPYRFVTGSHHSMENVISELEKMLVLNNGVLIGVPFMLTVKMVSGIDNRKFPIWNLFPIGTLSTIRERGQRLELSPNDRIKIPESRQLQPKDTEDTSFFSSQYYLDNLLFEAKKAKTKDELKLIFENAKKLLNEKKLLEQHFDALRSELNRLITNKIS